MWAFPWGVKDGPLENETGPDEWQAAELREIGARLKFNPHKPIKRGTASGHGIGKTTQVSFITLWAMTTAFCCRGVITANTATQLETKTWAELSKWFGMLIPPLKAQFELTATALYHVKYTKEWRVDAIPNNPKKPAAFAGMHNAGRRILMIFDEASEIEDPIWETTEGAMTDKDTEIIWLTYGNPTKNTGRFRENMVGKFRGQWTARQIDSRRVKRTNKDVIQAWIDAFGEDSDFVRVRVKGVFPRLGSMQLIPSDLVAAARVREIGYLATEPLVAGLDIARYGDDGSVLAPRRGRDARTIPWLQWQGLDLMQLAGDVALWCEENRPDALFVDVSGLGVGVYDRLVQLQVANVFPANFGSAGREVAWTDQVTVRTANLRASMWCSMRQWLEFGAIPDEGRLEEDLTGTQYGFNGASEILLEDKAHMKARGLASPDNADALALTFAMPIAPLHTPAEMTPAQRQAVMMGRAMPGSMPNPRSGVATDYDIHADLK